MELTLKRLLEQAEFTKSRGRYDAQEVDELLDRAVAMAAKVEARLNQAIEEAEAAGGPSPDQIEAEVERRVAARLAEAGPSPAQEEAVAEEALRTIKLAQRTADAAVKEAREEADALLADARGRAEALDAETETRAAEARATLEAETVAERERARQVLAQEIAEIEGVREALRTDAALLERHVQEQRTQLRNAIGELQRLLDDPAGFRLPPQPDLADPEVPDLSPDPTGPEAAAPAAPEPAEAETAADVDAEPIEEAAEPAAEAHEPDEVVIGGTPDAGPPALAFDEVDHEAPGLDDAVEGGPPTAPVDVVELDLDLPAEEAADATPARSLPTSGSGDEEDAFLAELRKAMKDDEPLGPRDAAALPPHEDLFEDDRRSWRFGKRR